jgi:hypothetical protein
VPPCCAASLALCGRRRAKLGGAGLGGVFSGSFKVAKGEVSEWLKEHAWKACVGETLPWVRIPPSPPPATKFQGEVPERSNGTVSKTVDRATGPWVRIPPSPPMLAGLAGLLARWLAGSNIASGGQVPRRISTCISTSARRMVRPRDRLGLCGGCARHFVEGP